MGEGSWSEDGGVDGLVVRGDEEWEWEGPGGESVSGFLE